MKDIKSVLFIRRDNIGDLVCTTPAIRAFRASYPSAKVCALVNSYNAEAVRNNPDIDEVFVYEKEKHAAGKSRLKVALENLKLLVALRAMRFDVVIACSYAYSARLARYSWAAGGKVRIGYAPSGKGSSLYTVAVPEHKEAVHEVEAVMGLLGPLGISGPPPSMSVWPAEAELEKAQRYIKRVSSKGRLVIFHISSRKPNNRWPRESFKELAGMIQREYACDIMLLWSPGRADNALHPGDDEAAEWLLSTMEKKPLAYRTDSLLELIAAMSLGDLAVCCDGGAMHIAAALGKPVFTVWGSTDRRRWAPWGVPHVIMQNGKNADSVTPAEAFSSFKTFHAGLFKGRP